MTAANTETGFKHTGIYLFNPSAIPNYFFDTSKCTERQRDNLNEVPVNEATPSITASQSSIIAQRVSVDIAIPSTSSTLM